MRRITEMVLLVVLLLVGITQPALSEELRWKVLYRKAVEHLNPKNKHEFEWERLNQKITDASAGNGTPDQVISLAEQTYNYAAKHFGSGHPFTNISRKRLVYDIYYKNSEKCLRRFQVLYLFGHLYPHLLNENRDEFEREWEEIYKESLRSVKLSESQKPANAAEQAYNYAMKYLGPEHPSTLISIEHLADFYSNLGRYQEAQGIYKQAIQIQEKRFGIENQDTLRLMNYVANLYNKLGRRNQAELLSDRVFQLRKKVLGEDHTDTLMSLHNLTMYSLSQGQKRKSEPLLHKFLQVYNRIHGEHNMLTIKVSIELAKLFRSQGKYNEAEQLLQELAEALLGDTKWKPELVVVYIMQKKYSEAEAVLKEVINQPQEPHGPNIEYDTLLDRERLAALYMDMERYSEAETLFKEVLALKEKYYGKEQVYTISTMHNLAVLYKKAGKHSKAEPLFQKALKLREKELGRHNHKTIGTLAAYIFSLFAADRFDTAFSLMQDWESRLLSRSFQELYTSSSHNVRRLYERTVNFFLNTVSSLAAQYPKEKYQHYAADVLLRWKQLYAEEEAFQYQQLARSSDPEIIELRAKLAEARVRLSLAERQNKKEEEIAELLDDFNEAETALLTQTKRFKSNLEVEGATLEQALSSLPPGSGLIEYRRFRAVDLHADKTKEPRLAALLLLADPNNGRRFIFRDLGPFAELDKLLDDLETLRSKIAALRDKIADLDRNEQKREFSALLEQLANLQKEKDRKNTDACRILLDPFEQQIRNLKQLYIAPDGRVNFLSFASTRLPDGRFLAERQQINRLQTGRDLIENGKDFSRGKGLIAVGGVTYGPKPAKDDEEQEKLEPQPKFVLRTTRQFGDGFVYLKGSRIEAKNIFAKYENNTQGKRFIGDDASEYNLKHLKQPPRILHLSTHGFYLTDEKKELADEAPLLLSGLALAGANNGLQGKLDKHDDDGLLYSLEVLGLNLQGTELVSLSACDTGKGVVDYSEGVYGLVRAFRTAGAKNVLMTLTPVGDRSSREFMETFYDHYLSENLTPSQALHKTRMDFIHHEKPAYRDPAVWSPYVLVGR